MEIPAREGMKTILSVATAAGVKRIIVTSSFAAVGGNLWKKDSHIYDEDDFAPLELCTDGYGRSKILQENIIREFIKESEESKRGIPEIVTLHPTFVIGPTLTSERVSSAEGIAKIMNRKIPGLPNITMPTVDIRDVALAHVNALTTPDLHKRRIILSHESWDMGKIADVLDEEFKRFGYRVQTRRIGYCPLKLASYFDDQVKTILPLIGAKIEAKSNAHLVGVNYERFSIEKSLIDMGHSLIDQGLVTPDRRPK
jgi:nucleoside-diphosphate-sugar epimerase